ncbi:MAG: SDR family NAD(P)-dependent oxidoreductase [Sulfuricaulis sp.]|nr:SDR family NAD(P)-dependent oxidoreductase [Sulfuricaulis sp.]
MNLEFQEPSGRVALVTGAAAGIGLAIAQELAAAGFITVMAGRSPNVLEAATSLAAKAKAPVSGHICDVAHEAQITDLMQLVDERFGRCDVLVNNAGIHPKKNGGKVMVEETTTEQWNDVLAINLTAPFLFSRAVLPMMRRHGWGRIINIGSRGGRTASPAASSHYAASKAGMIGFTRILALEGAAIGVTANYVAPGPIVTGMTAMSTPEVRATLAKSVPLGRYGEPSEISSVVSFLASEGSSFMTGSIIDVNGGSFMP